MDYSEKSPRLEGTNSLENFDDQDQRNGCGWQFTGAHNILELCLCLLDEEMKDRSMNSDNQTFFAGGGFTLNFKEL